MKNIKLGIKIGGGFGVLILIACILGGMAVFNMKGVEGDSIRLAKEYVPEVGMANEIERSSLLAMYAWRGYAFTEEQTFLDEGRKKLAAVQQGLGVAEKHAQTYPSLVKLKEQVVTAKGEVAAYVALSDQTVEVVEAMHNDRKALDQGAALYMKNCADYLESQNEAMKREMAEGASAEKLSERLDKITWLNDIIDLGNDTRIKVWRAQATRDLKLVEAAMDNFPKMEGLFDKLKTVTRQEVNLKQIAATREAAMQYKTAMNSLGEHWKELDQINAKRAKSGQDVLAAAQQTAEAGLEGTQKIADEAVQNLSTASTVMIGGLTVGVLIGIFTAVFLTKAITVPVQKGVDFARKLAQGDLTAEVDVNQKDELGILAQALREMVAKLREVVSEVQSASDNVASGSEELSASAEQLSQGATEQAASVEEVSSSMEEMSSNIRQNADNATQTEKIALKAAQDAQAGGQAVV
uniref:methyl-accepting chemotaxis protein n=1 Tax=Desulfomicrobium escambiense TaxID=29503 RepID=UPI00048FD3EB